MPNITRTACSPKSSKQQSPKVKDNPIKSTLSLSRSHRQMQKVHLTTPSARPASYRPRKMEISSLCSKHSSRRAVDSPSSSRSSRTTCPCFFTRLLSPSSLDALSSVTFFPDSATYTVWKLSIVTSNPAISSSLLRTDQRTCPTSVSHGRPRTPLPSRVMTRSSTLGQHAIVRRNFFSATRSTIRSWICGQLDVQPLNWCV